MVPNEQLPLQQSAAHSPGEVTLLPDGTQSPHSWVLVLHAVVDPPQSLSVLHPQPVGVMQARLEVLVEQSVGKPPLTQTLLAVLQLCAGVKTELSTPPHEPARHCVWLVAVHCTHAPLVVLHAGVEPEHWASAVQAVQVLLLVLHTGVVPLHWVRFVAVHCTHAPLVVLHAGVEPEHWLSDVHAVQVLVVVLHTGVVPLHWVRFVAVHCTHAPLVVLHDGVEPEH